MRIDNVLKEQLNKISVSKEKEYSLKKSANELIKRISNKNVMAIIGGSLAKGTLIKKEVQDIDIFVVFENETGTGGLESILKKLRLNIKRIHGSRDYFQIEKKKERLIFEIIPVVSLENLGGVENAKNVTDVSLMHVDYIKKKISKDRKLSDEIKLAKAFCFAQDVYGAESYIKGFSGYALEVLVCYFGSFIKFLRNINRKKVIDPEKYFKNEREILHELNESKLQSPIVLVDPTYKYRNVTAGLGKETFERLLVASRNFLKKPSLSFFEKKQVSADEIKKFAKQKMAKFFEISLRTNRQEGDIAGTKMRKFFDFLCKELERKEQRVIKKEFVYSGVGQESKGYIVIREKKEIEVGGVPLELIEAVKNFKRAQKSKRQKTHISDGKIYTKEKVDLVHIFSVIKQFEEDMGVEFDW